MTVAFACALKPVTGSVTAIVDCPAAIAFTVFVFSLVLGEASVANLVTDDVQLYVDGGVTTNIPAASSAVTVRVMESPTVIDGAVGDNLSDAVQF